MNEFKNFLLYFGKYLLCMLFLTLKSNFLLHSKESMYSIYDNLSTIKCIAFIITIEIISYTENCITGIIAVFISTIY